MLNFITWNPDPVALSLGPVEIRWYGIIYALGFFLAITIIDKIFKKENAPEGWIDKVFIYMILAVIIGARLGHVFFYGWEYYSKHPAEIFMIWHGGLASHGGAIALVICAWLMSKYVTKQSFFWLADRVFVGSSLVAVMIRIGNLMNSEIYGKPTDLPWGFYFLRGDTAYANIDGALHTFHYGDVITLNGVQQYCTSQALYDAGLLLPCHPTQIYESLAYLIVFILLMWLYWKKEGGKYNGLITGVGFTGIFIARQIIEFLKNPQETFEENMTFNMGQWLSLPFVIIGIILIVRAIKKGKVEYHLPQPTPAKTGNKIDNKKKK